MEEAHNAEVKDQNGSIKDDQEEEFDEERLCNICYFTDKDTVIIPCGHKTCFKCIQVHTLNR